MIKKILKLRRNNELDLPPIDPRQGIRGVNPPPQHQRPDPPPPPPPAPPRPQKIIID